ncbi:hypothetical protein SAMN05216389_11131 [Oceanobacillus limi]|uniref:Uncharacterized protein n=1 Tax=Oceanobacillus limi TaxID=930131 RepID=A0A1I0ECH2_9BACI|nr:hypothetical protein [Oceanobacillus limi]SET42657.1 hypothetical protein SAMN05216389_11131 [Oceanobacillus limi]
MSQQLADKIAKDFHEFMSEFHRYNQPYDDNMDADIHERYAKVLREQSRWGYFDFNRNPDGIKRPHFGPSSAGYSDRELYEKARKSKRDPAKFTENQRDWIGLGSQIGDYLQREILLAERHFEKLTGKPPRFKFERHANGNPRYEHFDKKMHEIEHNGQHFAYFGLPDGILEYITDDGEKLRVGLEIKSVQQNWSKFKSLDAPKAGHIAQTTAYSDMYDFDYVIVAYMLTYGRGWNEDFSRLKTFGKYVLEGERLHLRDRCADAVRRAKENDPPPLDLADWKFNDYKTVIAKSLTEDELFDLRRQADMAQQSNLPAWQKRSYAEAIAEIEEIRSEHNHRDMVDLMKRRGVQ